MRRYFILIFLGLSLAQVRAGNEVGPDTLPYRNYPVPKHTERLMFYVQRSHNRNTVIYELNYRPDGTLDPKEPLHALWIRFDEGGARKELSMIQNRVFGLDVNVLDKESWMIRFRSFKKRDIYLVRGGSGGNYRVLVKINGRMAELTRLFLCTVTNSLGIPSVIRYIDIHGTDPVSHEPVMERVIP